MQRQRPQGSKRPAPPLTGNTSRLAPLTPGVPETLQCNVATGNPRPIPARRSAAAPLHVVVPRSTCNVQPATPRAASPRAAAPLRPSTWSSHVQPSTPRASSPRAAAPRHVVVPRSTCNVQPSTPRASSPRASCCPRDGPRRRCGRSRAAPLHVVVPRSTCNVQPSPPRASSPRLAPRASSPHTTGDRRIRITQRSSAVASVKV